MRITEAFARFLKRYITVGHTVDDESREEIDKLTEEFIDRFHTDFFFTTFGTVSYLMYIDLHISAKNRPLFKLNYDENRYVDLLEKWIKKILSENLTLRIV